jgi:mannose-6-phosphate isomerase-like protein (cupin superfamily)
VTLRVGTIQAHLYPEGQIMRMSVINLLQVFQEINEYWSPKVVGCVNDQYVKIAKLKGQLAWHKHDLEDELFQVVKGQLLIQLEDDEVVLKAGEFCIVPRGVMHNPIADEECWIVLVETVTTKHTGDVDTPLTKTIEEQLSR